MLPNMDPRQMEKLMRQMGIASKQLDAKRVLIETDEGTLIIEPPQVTQITMQGQTSFQIAGPTRKEESAAAKEEDVALIMEKTGCSREKALEALQACNGDIAEAIIKVEDEK